MVGNYSLYRLNKRLELVKERMCEVKDEAWTILQNEAKKNRKEEWKKIIVSFEINIKGVLGMCRENKWASLVALRW